MTTCTKIPNALSCIKVFCNLALKSDRKLSGRDQTCFPLDVNCRRIHMFNAAYIAKRRLLKCKCTAWKWLSNTLLATGSSTTKFSSKNWKALGELENDIGMLFVNENCVAQADGRRRRLLTRFVMSHSSPQSSLLSGHKHLRNISFCCSIEISFPLVLI